jgi:5,10-methylenetetrahydromethanopterin reductase
MSAFEVSVAFQTDKAPADYDMLGALVNRYPFDAVSVYNDLFFQPALGPLLQLARQVTHARLGPAALNPFTLHPVEIAGQTALLDMATGGRAYLGLVRGSWLDTLGIDVRRPIARLRETIQVVRYLLAQRSDGFTGEIFKVGRGARLNYTPLRAEVPIVLGTWGRRTARALGPLVDEVKVGGSTNPDMASQMRKWLPPEVGVCLGAVSVVDRDRSAARALARRELALYLPVVAALDVTLEDPEWTAHMHELARQGNSHALAADIPDALLDRFAFSGTPDDILRQVTAIRAAGATRVEFGTPHGLESATGLRLLGEEVLPHLNP